MDTWPKKVLVRLHLSGLESFKVANENVAVEWSVASNSEHEQSTSLKDDIRFVDIEKDSPYFTEVRIVGKEKTIPLNDGYFEVPMPVKLLEGNPETITLKWIDFYRR